MNERFLSDTTRKLDGGSSIVVRTYVTNTPACGLIDRQLETGVQFSGATLLFIKVLS